MEKSTKPSVQTTEENIPRLSLSLTLSVRVPYICTPQQNLGQAQSYLGRVMLADSKLPHRFWAEAFSTVVYLRNRSPTKALEGITPFEAWHCRTPDVSACSSHFGCCAYVHIPKVERRKLDVKTRKCILLGYGNYGQRTRQTRLQQR